MGEDSSNNIFGYLEEFPEAVAGEFCLEQSLGKIAKIGMWSRYSLAFDEFNFTGFPDQQIIQGCCVKMQMTGSHEEDWS